jgi:ribosomal protein L40E
VLAATNQVGHHALLVVLFVFGLLDIVITFTYALAGFFIGIIIAVVSTEAIYQDAKAINKLKGVKVVSPIGWSLFAFVFWVLALPWYVFSKRPAAMAYTNIPPAPPAPLPPTQQGQPAIAPATTVIHEKEIHYVVQVPCKYCGALNDQFAQKCHSCGAPQR